MAAVFRKATPPPSRAPPTLRDTAQKKRSAFQPASAKAPRWSVPPTSPSTTAGRTATGPLSGGLHRPHEGAHELPIHLRRDGVGVDPFTGKKLPGVVHPVD